MRHLGTAAELAGAAAIAAGVALIYLPAGLIVAGVLLVILAQGIPTVRRETEAD